MRVVTGTIHETRAGRRGMYRALAAMPGWHDVRDILDTVERLTALPAGCVDQSSQVAVVSRTRRAVTLRAL